MTTSSTRWTCLLLRALALLAGCRSFRNRERPPFRKVSPPVAFEIPNDATTDDEDNVLRRDVMGEVQHASMVAEYRFDEPYGSTSIFGGLGFYRHSTDEDDLDSDSDYGFQFGLNADFPISRKYGAIVEATYHMSRGAFSPRYFTLTGGLRLAF